MGGTSPIPWRQPRPAARLRACMQAALGPAFTTWTRGITLGSSPGTAMGGVVSSPLASVDIGSPLTCLYTGKEGSRIYYLSSGATVHELAWTGNGWAVT